MSIVSTIISRAARRVAPLGLGILMLGACAAPASATQSQAFYCIDEVDNPPAQPFTVPQGVAELQIILQGAHGGNAASGVPGGFGGLVQATFAIGPTGPLRPGQALEVWVGCYAGENPRGYGNGGGKGVANDPLADDGRPGGGGSAVIDRATEAPLVVAGGGGGGGGTANSRGGSGGSGGAVPEPGQDGSSFLGSSGGRGGCVKCQGEGEIDGLDGGGSSTFHAGGGGGGGGGGYPGGGGGEGGNDNGTGGGGGGAGASYVVSTAAESQQDTSNLAQDGAVLILWGGTLRDTDRDGVPNRHDRCRRSDLAATVRLGWCDTRARNDLDVDGCTIADRIARITRYAKTEDQFVRRITRLWRDLTEEEFLTPVERRAFRRCASKVKVSEILQ